MDTCWFHVGMAIIINGMSNYEWRHAKFIKGITYLYDLIYWNLVTQEDGHDSYCYADIYDKFCRSLVLQRLKAT